MGSRIAASRVILVTRDTECLPKYRVTWWEDGFPQQRMFLCKSAAIRFYRTLGGL